MKLPIDINEMEQEEKVGYVSACDDIIEEITKLKNKVLKHRKHKTEQPR